MAETIFVTGGTGAIGRHVTAELLARGYKVAALVRSATQKVPGARSVIGDIRGLHKVVHKVGSCAGAIHLASTRSDDIYRVVQDDILGTLQLSAMFRDRPVVYASSQTVYGLPTRTLRESQPLAPVTWYDFGLCASEHVMTVAGNYDTRAVRVTCRLAPVVVHGLRKTEKQFFTSIFQHCDADGTFLVDSAAGLARYGTSFLGPADTARALVDCLSLTKSATVNLTGGFTTWRTLIDRYNAAAETAATIEVRRDVAPRRSSERRLPQSRSQLDGSRMRALTGFRPEERLRELIRAYRDDAA